MRFTGRRRISRRGCVGIIEAAANLSLTSGVAWEVGGSSRDLSPGDLAPYLVTVRQSGTHLTLPPQAKFWFPLSYAVVNARYALAFQYVWALSVVNEDQRESVAGAAAVDVLMWWLRHNVPAECAADLRRAKDALSAAHQRL